MNISPFKKLKYISILILFFWPILSYDHWTTVKDETFNWETTYDGVKWLLFFYKKDSKICNDIYNLLNSVMKKFIDKKVGFVLIDSIKCPWLVNRFNVTYLPKIILLEEDLMYNFYSKYNEENIINFINKKKPIKSALKKPKGAGLKIIYKNYGKLLSHKINNSMQYILDKLHIPLKWNKYYTIFFFFIFLIIFMILSFFSLILFCKIINDFCCCSLCRRTKERTKQKSTVKEGEKEKID